MKPDIQTRNDYILLTPDEGTSMFGSQTKGSFFVAFVQANDICAVGDKVHLYPQDYPKIVVGNTEYRLAKIEDVVGVENAS